MKKSLDKVAQRIFASFIGAGVFTFLLLFGISTITNNPLKADAPSASAATGKYMMDQCVVQGQKSWYFQILVWDTETGKSKLYVWSHSSKNFVKDKSQLPSSPIY